MRKVVTKEETTYTCNECNIEYTSDNISVEEIDDFWLMVYEKDKGWFRNHLARNLAGRTLLDFCSKDCIKKYLGKRVDIFVQELTWPKNPAKWTYFTK